MYAISEGKFQFKNFIHKATVKSKFANEKQYIRSKSRNFEKGYYEHKTLSVSKK